MKSDSPTQRESILHYYDRVLLSIPLTGIITPSLLFVAGLSFPSAVCAGFAPAVLIIGHALFIRGPMSDCSRVDEAIDHTEPHSNRRCN